jgi:hypothetical protein
MKIREHAQTWPPHVLIGLGRVVIADMVDRVLGARRYDGATDDLTLYVRKKDGTEYMVVLDLPPRLYRPAHIAIVRAKESTLGEIGELHV